MFFVAAFSHLHHVEMNTEQASLADMPSDPHLRVLMLFVAAFSHLHCVETITEQAPRY